MTAPPPNGARLRSLLASFGARRVLVLGDLVADHYVFGQTDRVSREAPVLIVRYESSEVKLGGAANAAANVRSLGGQVATVGVVGNDATGTALKEQLTELGIVGHFASARGLETETKSRILAGGLNTTRQQMLRVDRGNRTPLPVEVQTELAGLLESAARDADAILVSDYGAGVCNPATLGVLHRLAQAGVPICVDSRYALAAFRGMTLCKPNEPELEALTGKVIRGEGSLLEAAALALEQLGCRALLVTRGRHGMALFEPTRTPVLFAVHGSEEAVDVTGAGDTVIATLTLALAAGAELGDAAHLANLAGGIVVQKPGTATIPAVELLAGLAP